MTCVREREQKREKGTAEKKRGRELLRHRGKSGGLGVNDKGKPTLAEERHAAGLK